MESRLRELRKYLEMSQGEFGKKINLSTSAIGEIERGTNKLSDRNIAAICHVFNVNEEWLRTGEGEMFNPPKELTYLDKLAAEKGLTPEDMVLIKSFLELPPEMRRSVIEFGKNFMRNMSAQLGLEPPVFKEDRKSDEELTVAEKRRIINEELDAEEKREIFARSIATSGLRDKKKYPR